MSDYLSNLVAGSLSETAAVRPHVPSIFESPSVKNAPGFFGDAMPDPHRIEQEATHGQDADRLWQMQSMWGLSRGEAQVAGTAATRTGGDEPRHSEPIQESSITDPGAEPSGLSSRARKPGTSPRSIGSEQISATESSDDGMPGADRKSLRAVGRRTDRASMPADESEADRADSLRASSEPHSKGAPFVPAARPNVLSEQATAALPFVAEKPAGANEPHTSAAKSRLSLEHGDEASQTEREYFLQSAQTRQRKSTAIVPVAPALIVPASRALPAAQVERKLADEAPAIHVTIGRIEVRAVTMPQRSSPQQTRASVMSLDDYLHQRAGGGRR